MKEMSKISEGTKEVPAGFHLSSPKLTLPTQEAKKTDSVGKAELKVTVNGHLNGVNGHSVTVEGRA